MQWFRRTPNFDFMGHSRYALTASLLVTLVSLLSIAWQGLNLGIDFTGGVVIEASYAAPADGEDVRSALSAGGFESAQVQNFGSPTDVLIRLPPPDPGTDMQALRDRLLATLRAQHQSVELRRVEAVGSQVGADLAERGGLAMLFALIIIFVYVMLRFRWKLALGAIVATIHDVIVTIGFFSLLGLQFDLNVLGSVLAVLGYSLNDTIVVYDRIRDNFRHMRRGAVVDIINASVNQTLARTLVTGITTLLVLGALLFIGGDALWGFSVALIVGIIVGTYSSIYVGSAMALWLAISPSDFAVVKHRDHYEP